MGNSVRWARINHNSWFGFNEANCCKERSFCVALGKMLYGNKEETMSKINKVEIVLIQKAHYEGEGDDRKLISEKVLAEDTRWVEGELPAAEDIKDEPKFREARGSLKPSEVEVRVFTVPFAKI